MVVYSLRPPQVGIADIEKVLRFSPHGSAAPWHKDQLCHTSEPRDKAAAKREEPPANRGFFHSFVREGGLELTSTPSRRESRLSVLPHEINDL
jgi:hypothetical protein